MRTRCAWLLLLLTLMLWSAAGGEARACSCILGSEPALYRRAEYVVRAQALGSFSGARGERWYLAWLTADPYKGCLSEHSLVWIQTQKDEESCGVELEPDTEYLLHAQSPGRALGLRVLETGLCDGDGPFAELSDEALGYLNTREVCCGRHCECVASERVQCLIDPCETSTCSESGSACRASYCGGCTAEWFDSDGYPVCLPNVAAAP